MRLLFLTSAAPDFLQDLTWAGLAECLGPGAVADVPRRPDYHAPLQPYPFGQGFVPGEPAPEATLDEARAALARGAFDAVFAGAAKPEPFRSLASLRQGGLPLPPTVFVDGGDSAALGGACPEDFRAADAARPFDLILKRECLPAAAGGRVLPCPFSVNPRAFPVLPPQPRDVAVYFSARPASEVRVRAAALLRRRFPDIAGDLPDVFPQPEFRRDLVARIARRLRRWAGATPPARAPYLDLPQVFRRTGEQYLADLSRAQVAVSLRGWGFDTFRYWEIPFAGALLVSERLPIVIPNDFRPDREAVFVEPDLGDLCDRIAYFVAHPAEREAIAHAGHAHLLAHHTARARAEGILAALRAVVARAVSERPA